MILNIDTDGKEFVVTRNPQEKRAPGGEPRIDKTTGQPLWATQIVVTDGDGGEIISVNTAGIPPAVEVGDEVEVTRLVAIPWTGGGRSGIAYRADAIQVIA